ncbi:MAG: [protein-PII] uridylyltransferase [Acidimicrobiia bacterium]
MSLTDRNLLLANTSSSGAAFCRALSDATDAWLADVFAAAIGDDSSKLALVAVGGYGRRELAPASDLDVLLLDGGRKDIAKVAERLWYPLWDAKVKLGHAVRTVKDAIKLASDDLDTATSFLTIRHLAGDSSLTEQLRSKALEQWTKKSAKWLSELDASSEKRRDESAEVAFLLEPNLKVGRGGLRDVHALQWAQLTGIASVDADRTTLDNAYEVLLLARVELHRLTGRPGDVLLLQEQDAVADALGYKSADALMSAISSAARSIAWVSDGFWRRVRRELSGKTKHVDRALSSGIHLRDGEVVLEEAYSSATDPTLLLRVAAAAARHDAHIDPHTLDRLARDTPPFHDPWPAGAVDDLVALLLTGRPAIDVIESLDQHDLVTRILPEWGPVRSKPQRNAYHRFTVDRHLLETAANAAALADRVQRPDLLVIGALLHDIGKGYRGDHTEVGITLLGRIGPRLGLSAEDTAMVAQMIRHHLLLPDVATRRDLSDSETIAHVASEVGTTTVLELLGALTEADSIATSTAAWSAWKAELVDELVSRTAHVLGGGSPKDDRWTLFPSPEVQALMGERKTAFKHTADRLTVVAHDRPGLFSKVAGVLSLHGLDVVAAQAHSDEQGMAASEFRVSPPKDGPIAWPRVIKDLELAVRGRLALDARLAERAKAYARRRRTAAKEVTPRIVVDGAASSNATVLEVHAPDSIGILYRITHTLADMGLDIRHAKVSTLGHEVVDSFYVRDADGAKVTEKAYLAEIERALIHVLGSTSAVRTGGR